VTDDDERRRFEALALPHLGAAYNLARWLTGNGDDAQDVVQEATLRAMRYFAGFRGDQARPWLLQIVRHTAWSWMKDNRAADQVSLDDDGPADGFEPAAPSSDEPPAQAIRNADRALLNQALASLPPVFREVLVLRELEDLPYRDIARIVDIPIGTVMSRLARARGLMRLALAPGARPALRSVSRPAQAGGR
jgi:RNA polymerase sigma-70 factor (ECF subfamily)